MAFARQAGGNAEARQPDGAGLRLEQDVGRLEVFVDETARMQARNGPRQRDGNAQELRQLHRWPEQVIQELTTRVREQQHCPPILVQDLQRLNRPFRSEFVLQLVLVLEPRETFRSRMFRGKG